MRTRTSCGKTGVNPRKRFFRCLGGGMLGLFFFLVVHAEATAPEEFTKFSFREHELEAGLLSDYLWRFFSRRAINPMASFEQEYLTVSDLWLAEAYDPHSSRKIQEVHREHLLSIEMDDEGYVHTHQHFSHAHEHGWPFPLWPQIHGGYEGYTYGWHFQDRGRGWVWDHRMIQAGSPCTGQTAADRWTLENARSLGIQDSAWRLQATGPSPAIVSPEGVILDAFNAPFIQIRWKRTEERKSHLLPYLEWQREQDGDFNAERRFYFEPGRAGKGLSHCMIPVYRHPKWEGKIKRLRIALAPGELEAEFAIDSIFTQYDTRHSINNPILILASWEYFRWTGDIDFLRKNINRLRRALRYQQTEMGGLKWNHIRNEWPGHDGLPGWTRNADGTLTMHPGHGIGNNYWDLMPFGWDDLYATSHYYRATLTLARLEESILRNPGWGVPLGPDAFDPETLRKHADQVRKTANHKFWNKKTGRFFASIDKKGTAYDYGYTFLNLEAIWYGLASDAHASDIMNWISGKRIVEGDTSQGADLYHWRFGPRATTKRNLDWYGQGWIDPGAIPWGGQVQDGGAVLGFTFFDLWGRIQVLGPDNAWQRLGEILQWEAEVQEAGGYRAYYADGKQGTTLQGGGTAGGLGIDHEFLESSLLPVIVPYGFLGLDPDGERLTISPRLPAACPEMKIENLLFQNCRMDIAAGVDSVTAVLKDRPPAPIRIALPGRWKAIEDGISSTEFELSGPGIHRYERMR